MEIVVSLLIMGILITTIMTVIRLSLVMTGDSLSRAREAQVTFNDLILNNDGAYNGGTAELLFTITVVPFDPDDTAPPPTYVIHDVELSGDDNIVAFRPVGGAP